MDTEKFTDQEKSELEKEATDYLKDQEKSEFSPTNLKGVWGQCDKCGFMDKDLYWTNEYKICKKCFVDILNRKWGKIAKKYNGARIIG